MKEGRAVIVSSETWRTTLGRAVEKVTSRVSGVTNRKETSFLDRSEDSFSHGEEVNDVRAPVIRLARLTCPPENS